MLCVCAWSARANATPAATSALGHATPNLAELLERGQRVCVGDRVAIVRGDETIEVVAALEGLAAKEVDLAKSAGGQVLVRQYVLSQPVGKSGANEIWPPIEFVDAVVVANSSFSFATIVSRTLFARSNFRNSLRSSRLRLRPIGRAR